MRVTLVGPDQEREVVIDAGDRLRPGEQLGELLPGPGGTALVRVVCRVARTYDILLRG